MHYRLFEHGDFEDLYAIEELCFKLPERFSRRYMRQVIGSRSAVTWVAEEGGKMTGFGIVESTQQLPGIVAYILTIEVLREWREQGIGAELLHKLEVSASDRNAIAIWLHVDAENAPAIRLYERSGYRNSGRAEHFYSRNRPAIIYVKDLIGQGE